MSKQDTDAAAAVLHDLFHGIAIHTGRFEDALIVANVAIALAHVWRAGDPEFDAAAFTEAACHLDAETTERLLSTIDSNKAAIAEVQDLEALFAADAAPEKGDDVPPAAWGQR